MTTAQAHVDIPADDRRTSAGRCDVSAKRCRASDYGSSIRKTIVFVRHGQSEYNVAVATSKEDPWIRDAPLTDRGREQAKEAQAQLKSVLCSLPAVGSSVCVVSSPMRRAIETATLVKPDAAGTIQLWPQLRENVDPDLDLGTPASELRQSTLVQHACGPDASCLQDLDEVWWTVPPEFHATPAGVEMEDAFRESAKRFEDTDRSILLARVEKICDLIANLEQAIIVIVAHAGIIGSLTKHLGLVDEIDGQPGWGLKNAEVRVARDVHLRSTDAKRSEGMTMPL